MIETVKNNLQNSDNKKLTSSILPNFAHKCALLNWHSYTTSANLLFEFKRDFKRFKWVPVWLMGSTEYLSKSTMRKLNKIKLFVFGKSEVLRAVKQEFKKYLKNVFSDIKSLQSNQAVESFICVSNKASMLSRGSLSTVFIKKLITKSSICVSNRVAFSSMSLNTLCDFYLIKRSVV